MGGGLTGLNDLVVGFATSVIDPSSGFSNSSLPLAIPACAPSIPLPAGTPSSLGANPDPSATASNSLRVSFVEGFVGSFVNTPFSDNGGVGTQGIRFRIQLTGIPNGIAVYAPEIVSAASLASTGTVLGGSAATAITLVANASLDGSGGVPLPAAFPNRFDLVPVNSGTATLIYEVTSSAGTTGLETVSLFIALAGASPSDQGLISGAVSLAPIGTPTLNPAVPQFNPPAGTTLAAAVLSCSGPLPTFPSAPSILLSLSRLGFISPFGTIPTPQAFDVLIAGASPLNWTASITSISGGNWLSLSPTSGTGNTRVIATAQIAGLPLGSYSANISFTAPGATDSPFILPVTMDIVAVQLTATPASLSFTAVGGTNPASQQLTIGTNAGTLTWRASATTSSGGNWLSVSPSSGNTPGTATVSVNSQSLTPGVYQGSVTISADGAGNGPQVVTVSLSVGTPPPAIVANGILNSASYSKDAVVAGSIASIFGSNFATTTAVATSYPLPTVLAGTQVLVNNSPAPLYFVSPTQINFQMPQVAGSTALVVVVSNQSRSLAATVTLANFGPGLFTLNSSGSGQGLAVNQDITFNSAQNPAAAGSVIALFGTGLGATNPSVNTGEAASSTSLTVTVTKPVVLIGGVSAEVLFSGIVPGTAGFYQINARIPAGVSASAAVPVVLLIGGANSNTVTIAVR